MVSWALPTRHESLVLAAALARLGAVQNPIIPICRDREFGSITGQAGTKLVIEPGTFRAFDFAEMAERLGVAHLTAAPALPDGNPSTLPPQTRAAVHSRRRAGHLALLHVGHHGRPQGRPPHRRRHHRHRPGHG